MGPLAYFLRAGQALFTTKDYTYRIKTENDDFICKSPLVLALLTNVVSSFERFMPEASVDDGYMRIIIFKEYFILDILSVLPLIISGAIYNSRYTTTLTVKKAHIELLSNIGDLPTNMDGDQGPSMPVDIEVLPRVLKVFAPAKHTKEKGFEFAYTTTYLINCEKSTGQNYITIYNIKALFKNRGLLCSLPYRKTYLVPAYFHAYTTS